MPGNDVAVVYWDASAILSALFQDSHSRSALDWSAREGVHFMSTLAWAEVCAVVSRMKRARIISGKIERTAYKTVAQGPWRQLTGFPDWEITSRLCRKWALRGADLWHLSTAKNLQKELPELVLLTFDQKLLRSARGEGLLPEG